MILKKDARIGNWVAIWSHLATCLEGLYVLCYYDDMHLLAVLCSIVWWWGWWVSSLIRTPHMDLDF